jgi:hypothetical protein
VLLEHIEYSSTSAIQSELDNLISWCDTNSLVINATKTKELIFSNRRHSPNPPPINIHGGVIERVTEYCYLGTILTSKLTFELNTSKTISKARKRLFIMHKLSYIGANTTTIKIAYTSFIESVLAYHIAIIYEHLTAENKRELNNVIRSAKRLSGHSLDTNILQLYTARFSTKCLRLINSEDPVIKLAKLPSGRCLLPKHRVNCRKQCFRTMCAKFYNNSIFRN